MGNLGFPEMLVIALVALLVFGPERLPELARQAGRLLGRLREETSRSVGELKDAADLQDLDREIKGLSRDLRDVRSSVSRALREGGTPSRRPESGAPSRRAEDAPPPTDPDAT